MCITIPFAFVPCVANASAFLRAPPAFVLSLSVDGAAPGVCSLLICLLYGVATLSFLSVHIVVYIYVSANLVAVCNRRSAKWSARKLMSMCHFRNLLTYMFLVLQVLHYSSLVGLLPPFILYCYTMYCGTGSYMPRGPSARRENSGPCRAAPISWLRFLPISAMGRRSVARERARPTGTRTRPPPSASATTTAASPTGIYVEVRASASSSMQQRRWILLRLREIPRL